MRFRHLDLLRYGPFTDRRLTFRDDARVHVIYGANEAGKSTALAAIADLLYGFPKSTGYDFLHDMKTLRLGADIIARDGRHLTFQRTKGNKSTLRQPDDTALPDDALTPFLGTVNRSIFLNAFGLSTSALRAGARAMLEQDGEIGAALIGAASGMGDLQRLQRRLEDQAGEIFEKRKSDKRKLWQAFDRFAAANAEIKRTQLLAPRWKQINDEIGQHADALDRLRAELKTNVARTHRLNRLTLVRPIIARIAGRLEAITTLGPLPAPSPDFARDLDAALIAIARTEEAVTTTALAATRAETELASVTVDTDLLSAANTIKALEQRLRSEQDARGQLARAREAKARSDSALTELAIALGTRFSSSDSIAEILQANRPTAAALALVQELARDHAELDQERRGLERQIAGEEANLDALERKREGAAILADPAPFRADLALFEADLADLEGLADQRLDIAEETRRLAEEAGRLQPPLHDLDHLAAAARPDMETIARFAADFDERHRDRERAQDAAEEARLAIRTQSRDLERLRSEGDVVTPESLAEARAGRDLAFAALKQVLNGETTPSQTEIGSGISAFEIAVGRADTLADTAIRDARRVEAFRITRLALQEAEERLKHQTDIINSQNEQLTILQEIWDGAWEDMRVKPLPPAEMREWLRKVERLVERRDEVERRRARLRMLEERAISLRRPLADLADRVGLTSIDGIDPRTSAERIARRIDDLSRIWSGARDTATLLEAGRSRLNQLRQALDAVTGRIALWQPRWEEALPEIGLARHATPTQAQAALEAHGRLQAALDTNAEASSRFHDLTETIASFAQDARVIVEILAADLSEAPAAEAVATLARRLQDARTAAARQEDLKLRQIAAATAAVTAAQLRDDAHARLDHLRASAGLSADIDLGELNRLLKVHADLSRQLASDRSLLAEQAEGDSEADLHAALAEVDPDTASAEQADLARQRERLEQQDRETYALIQRLKSEREALEMGQGAEPAMQRRASEEATMAELARDWLVLKLAATLVGKATSRHRAGHHLPLVERAGQLFARLTGGSFVGLDQDEDEDGRALLVGRRADGRSLPIGRVNETGARKSGDATEPSALSEGTLDQLYLAMRLAHLEDYARTSEPTPFIGDDLFMTFDDSRTGLGLEALADISPLIQPIVFTHHRRVAEIAVARLGAQADIVEL